MQIMANKFKKGDYVTVSKNGKFICSGIVKGWDYNQCTFEIQYDIDYLKSDRVFTMIGVTEENIKPAELTDRTTKLIDEFIDASTRYSKTAIENSEKWVSAGYAGGIENPDKLYCYCGAGNGYNGASLTPASRIAVIFDTKEEATKVLNGYTSYNGKGEKIVPEPMEAYKYFNILSASVYKAATSILYLTANK
nr:MAG TPA: SERINE PROTEINASE B COMPLEX WITH(SERINE PROTEINASE-INHIBITOR) [Caudoviricetes sp.]